MFKRVFLMVCVMLVCFCSVSMANSRIYYNEEHHFSIQLPEGFEKITQGDNKIMFSQDGMGGEFFVTSRKASEAEIAAETDKKLWRKLTAGYLKEYDKPNFLVYREFTVNINQKHFGYYVEGEKRDAEDHGLSKHVFVKFMNHGKMYEVTYNAPYASKNYLKSYALFRKAITVWP